MQEILSDYAECLWQFVNFSKSTIKFSPNVKPKLKEMIWQSLKILEFLEPVDYLGVPSFKGANRSNVLNGLEDKLSKRLNGYSRKKLFTSCEGCSFKIVA